MFLRRCFLFFLLSAIASPLFSQGTDPATGKATFKSRVNVVVVNVVVTDRSGNPVTGLDKDDFKVSENGHTQKVLSFEEHKAVTPTITKLPPLPPHVFTNFPATNTADAIDVILLDTLNTPMDDQSFVYLQVTKYLKSMQTGERVALFTLGSQLRMVQGFTTDSSVLLAALADKKRGGTPHPSLMLRTTTEDNADEQIVGEMKSMQAVDRSQALQESIGALQQFQGQTKDFQNNSVIDMTLWAFQQIAQYLGGIPGRKNVIWFSHAFPLPLSPALQGGQAGSPSDLPPNYLEDLRRTSAQLTASQVAIYPVAAEGLVAPNQDASAVPIGITNAQQATDDQVQSFQLESRFRNGRHATMDEIALETGGEAFYDTNGLAYELSRIISHGAQYYTLTYSPSDENMDGRYRRIAVKLRKGGYKLAYRRGYYTEDPKKPLLAQPADPLKPLMDPGIPDLAQILYNVKVLALGERPAPQAGSATKEDVVLRAPVIRYSVDFAILPNDLNFVVGPDGVRKGDVEVALIAYSPNGNMVSRVSRTIEMTLQPKLYAAFQQGGVQLHEEIDAPKGSAYLRTGIFDTKSNKAGTLVVPLAGIMAAN